MRAKLRRAQKLVEQAKEKKAQTMTEVLIPVISSGEIIGADKLPIPRVVGEIDAGSLTSRMVVPRRVHAEGAGYQRPVSRARVRRLAAELKAERVSLPTAVLLNLRAYDQSRNLVQQREQTCLAVRDDELHVVDGQHRLEALKDLIESDEGDWESFKIPFVCLLGASELEEMRQFHVVNSEAKSVGTDLANALLRERAKTDPEFRNYLVERGEDWRVRAQELAELLQETEPWRGRIRFEGEKKQRSMTIPSSGMVTSLKGLVTTSAAYFARVDQESQVAILAAFWGGVLRVLPDAREEPEAFTLQKMVGAAVLHSVLPHVIELIRESGGSVLNPADFEEVLRGPLQELEGQNSEMENVSGVEFWRSGPGGVAGGFSSNAGRRVIQQRIESLLPPITVH